MQGTMVNWNYVSVRDNVAENVFKTIKITVSLECILRMHTVHKCTNTHTEYIHMCIYTYTS